MRMFVAGATGALGRRLVPLLVANGHQVTAMTRRVGRTMDLYAAGAEPVVADALDRDAVLAAVTAARPDAVVHQLTDLAGVTNLRKFDQGFAATNRLRTEGTDHLLEAARAAGASRFVAQSFAGWPFAGSAGRSRPRTTRSTPTRRPSCGAPWTPSGTSSRPCSGPRAWRGRPALRRLLRPRHLGRGGRLHARRPPPAPLPGDRRRHRRVLVRPHRRRRHGHARRPGAGRPGIYQIVDDDPAPVSAWLPALAAAAGAGPRRVPAWLARLLAGEHAVVLMTEARGASNAKAGARLAPCPPELAPGIPHRPRPALPGPRPGP